MVVEKEEEREGGPHSFRGQERHCMIPSPVVSGKRSCGVFFLLLAAVHRVQVGKLLAEDGDAALLLMLLLLIPLLQWLVAIETVGHFRCCCCCRIRVCRW